MGIYKNKAYTLRIDNELMDKLRKIAEKEDRPLSKQIERIIKQYIDNYEKRNGNIKIEIGRDNNGSIDIN